MMVSDEVHAARIKVVTRFDKSSLGAAFLFQEGNMDTKVKEVIGLRLGAGATMP